MDVAIIKSLEKKVFQKKDFVLTENYNIRLRPDAVKKLIGEINSQFTSKASIRGKMWEWGYIISHKAGELADYLNGKRTTLGLESPTPHLARLDSAEAREKILTTSYAEWKKMGFSKGTLHYLKKNAKKVIALAIALTFLALSLTGCLGSNNGGGNALGSALTQCAKPWPASIDIIQVPNSMIVGQTYSSKCQMYVQNYYNCTPSPWWYAVDTPIAWTFNNNGTTMTNESITNDPYGIASVNFNCPSAGNWTIVARWAGNANYREAEGQANVSATSDYRFTNVFSEEFYDRYSNLSAFIR